MRGNFIFRALSIAIGLGFVAGSACAEPKLPAADWNGPFVGIIAERAGSGRVKALLDGVVFNQDVIDPKTLAGAEIGYMLQRGQTVYGVSVAHVTGPLALENYPNSVYTRFNELRFRLGHAQGQVLTYLTLGGATAHFDDNGSGAADVSGMVIGAGIARSFGPHLFGAIELNHRVMQGPVDFDPDHLSVRGTTTALSATLAFKF